MKKRGHEFKREQRGAHRRVWREEGEGGKNVITLQSQKEEKKNQNYNLRVNKELFLGLDRGAQVLGKKT